MTFPIADVSFKDMPFRSWQTSSESQERRVACYLDWGEQSWTVVATVFLPVDSIHLLEWLSQVSDLKKSVII